MGSVIKVPGNNEVISIERFYRVPVFVVSKISIISIFILRMNSIKVGHQNTSGNKQIFKKFPHCASVSIVNEFTWNLLNFALPWFHEKTFHFILIPAIILSSPAISKI